MIKNLIFITLLFLGFNSFAQQEEGTLIFRTYPVIGDLFVKINNADTLNTKPKISLPVGTYQLTLWAPDYLPHDTMVTIYPDSVVYMRKILSQTKEFAQYNSEKRTYMKKVVIPKVAYLTGSGLLTGATIVSYLNVQRNLDRTKEAFHNYEINEIFSIDRARVVYEKERDQYNKSKNTFYAISATTAISWGVTLWQLRRLKKKHPKPIYQPAAPYFDLTIIPSNSFGTGKDNSKNNLLFTFKINF